MRNFDQCAPNFRLSIDEATRHHPLPTAKLDGGDGGQVEEESPLAASPGSESLARKATRSHWPISFELSKNCLSSPFNVVL